MVHFIGGRTLLLASCLAWSLLAQPLQHPAPLTLDQLATQHRQVLTNLNAKNGRGEVSDFDDPRMPALLKEGWTLAGAWAAAYFDTHPSPSKHDLTHIFDGFAPAPRGVKSKYGNFLDYPEYSFTGSAVRIGTAVYVAKASYFADSSTGTFIVIARNPEGHFQALWNIKDTAESHYAKGDEIGRWLFLISRAYYNGPLAVKRLIPPPSRRQWTLALSRRRVPVSEWRNSALAIEHLGLEWPRREPALDRSVQTHGRCRRL